MFALHSSLTFYFYRGPCDMRKSFNGLSGLMRNELVREPAGGDVFCFSEPKSHPFKTAALGAGRVCPLLQKAGAGNLHLARF